MSFEGKCTELEILKLKKISQAQRPNIVCSRSFVEPRPKMMMVMRHECKQQTLGGSA
jgi:hypothetical protein